MTVFEGDAPVTSVIQTQPCEKGPATWKVTRYDDQADPANSLGSAPQIFLKKNEP